MSQVEYDNIDTCPKCGGVNETSEHEYITYHLSGARIKAKTNCENCGHEDYWAYGFFQSGHD